MQAEQKPFAPACERNREPILEVLRHYLDGPARVLEVGSGTGQHAVHFARELPQIEWQTSDLPEQLPGIRLWLDEAGLPNTPPPLAFDVTDAQFPTGPWDVIFTANTLHIMSWEAVRQWFQLLPGLVGDAALLIVYGPFRYGERHTSPSNAEFDAWLREQGPERGLRDLIRVDEMASAAGFSMSEDRELPANNRCVIWQRGA